MSASTVVLLFFVIPMTLLSVSVSLSASRIHQRRVAALRAGVAPWGWHVMSSTGQIQRRWHGHPFGGGLYRKAGHNVTGAYEGRSAVVFEYFVAWLERFSTTTVTVLAAPGRYEGIELTVLDREEELTKGSAGEDVLTGSPEFDAVWRVRSTDPQRALAILQPHVRDFLLQPAAGPVRIADGELLTWREGTIRLRKVHETLGWLARVDELVGEPAPKLGPPA